MLVTDKTFKSNVLQHFSLLGQFKSYEETVINTVSGVSCYKTLLDSSLKVGQTKLECFSLASLFRLLLHLRGSEEATRVEHYK